MIKFVTYKTQKEKIKVNTICGKEVKQRNHRVHESFDFLSI